MKSAIAIVMLCFTVVANAQCNTTTFKESIKSTYASAVEKTVNTAEMIRDTASDTAKAAVYTAQQKIDYSKRVVKNVVKAVKES